MFRLERQSMLCANALTARRFVVELSAEAEARLALELARAYVAPHRYSADPDALVAPRLPTADNSRKGDLGEFLTHRLYEQIFGHEIPFSRLWSKTAPNATQQGADTVSVLIDPTRDNQPFTAETKVRTGSTGSGELLKEISGSVGVTNDSEYLAAAWSAGLDKLDAHPRARSAYAYTAAHHLALLDGTNPEELPLYERHAVIITDGADLKGSTIETYWSPPPVSALAIVKIDGLNELIARLYAAAGTYSAGQLLGTTMSSVPFPPAQDEPARWVGLRSPLDPGALARWAASNSSPNPAIEAALWYLADHDGIARARALSAGIDPDPTSRALTQLLLGRDRTAAAAASRAGLSIEALLIKISEVLVTPGNLTGDREQIVAAAQTALAATTDPNESMAISLTVEAVCYRLPRQPVRMLASAGVTGPRATHIADSLYQQGIHAFWPSQSKSLEAGLLTSPPRPFVLRVPTSGGKTTLIALAAANALDHQPGSRVVVIAPSRALVNQLRTDLRRLLGNVQILALHGEIELGDEIVNDDGDLVTIMTPERFDLDWRRSVTIEELDPMEESISAVIVDEAHYIANSQRGARLELALSRVLRSGIPVTLASSQLGQLEHLADWVGGANASTDWQPAHHIRQVYFRHVETTDDGSTVTRGVLVDETKQTEVRLTIGAVRDFPQPDRAIANVGDQGAAIATQFQPDGPVVLYSATKRNIPNLVRHLHARVAAEPPDNLERLEELAEPLPVDATEDRALLLAGIGVHHRDVRQQMRTIVETAARGRSASLPGVHVDAPGRVWTSRHEPS